MDTELDAEEFVYSPSNKKVKCSTPLNKMIKVARSELLEEQYNILEEMIDLLPNVLNEMRKNGHLETWVNLNRLINQKSLLKLQELKDKQYQYKVKPITEIAGVVKIPVQGFPAQPQKMTRFEI